MSFKHEFHTSSPTPSFVETSFTLANKYLAGGEAVSSMVSVAACSYLVGVDVVVSFDGDVDPNIHSQDSSSVVTASGTDDNNDQDAETLPPPTVRLDNIRCH